MSGGDRERTLLVDASVFITLAEVGHVGLLRELAGNVVVPAAVYDEITDEPAASRLEAAGLDGWLRSHRPDSDFLEQAATHVIRFGSNADESGDVSLLATAFAYGDPVVVVTDDKPLRKICKALGIEVSGSIGVLVVSVETAELTAEDAKEVLYAVDAVGARLSASLVKRAEQMIDEVAGNLD